MKILQNILLMLYFLAGHSLLGMNREFLEKKLINTNERIAQDWRERFATLEKVLANKSDINEETGWGTPLEIAVNLFNFGFISLDVVDEVLRRGADINHISSTEEETPLTESAFSENKELVTLLLDKGAQVNKINGLGWTALMNAASINARETVEILLNHPTNPATVDAKNDLGETALMKVVERDDIPQERLTEDWWKQTKNTLLLLLKHKAHINAQNNEGQTPLILSLKFSNNNPNIAPFLIEQGANVNIPDGIGNTPLMYAIQTSKFPLIQLLLDHGARIDSKNKFGQDALGWIVTLLKSGRLNEAQKKRWGSIIESITQYADNNYVKTYPKEAFQVLPLIPQRIILLFHYGVSKFSQLSPHNVKKLIAYMLHMPNITPPDDFSLLLKKLSINDLETLVDEYLQYELNSAIFEMIAETLLRKLDKDDALLFLKVHKTGIDKLKTTIFDHKPLDLVRQLYVHAQEKNIENLSRLILDTVTTLATKSSAEMKKEWLEKIYTAGLPLGIGGLLSEYIKNYGTDKSSIGEQALLELSNDQIMKIYQTAQELNIKPLQMLLERRKSDIIQKPSKRERDEPTSPRKEMKFEETEDVMEEEK